MIRLGRVRLTGVYQGEPTQSAPRWERPGICRTAFEFLHVVSLDRLRAVEQLLLLPDPAELRRGRTARFEGAEDRFKRWLPVRVRAIRAREIAAFGLTDEALTWS